jgi:hypothetical protein
MLALKGPAKPPDRKESGKEGPSSLRSQLRDRPVPRLFISTAFFHFVASSPGLRNMLAWVCPDIIGLCRIR